MTDEVRTSLKHGLAAFQIHAAPKKVLKGLNAEVAAKRLSENCHTIWELLHHMIFWQDICLDAIDDKDVKWNRSKTENWPKADMALDQKALDERITHFLNGIESFSERAESVELESSMRSLPESSKVFAIQTIAQHNSYHLGQIVVLRQALGDWPAK
jgi:uncharacterized damage-inducible protein DinB